MRIGIMGGTFDPVHMGHLILAETIRSDYPLDKILFMPAAVPPHKQGKIVCSGEMRLRMLSAALEAYPYFDILDYELIKGGVSYTVDTVRWLHDSSPYYKDELFLIIGGDSLVEMDTWRSPMEILKNIKTLVVARPGFNFDQVKTEFLQAVEIVDTPLIEISASQIRQRVQNQQSIHFWVPEAVEIFIKENGLYCE